MTELLEGIRAKSKAQRERQAEWEKNIAGLDLEKDGLAARLNALSKALANASALQHTTADFDKEVLEGARLTEKLQQIKSFNNLAIAKNKGLTENN